MTAPLITSLEQAGEGSRELDAEIGRAFGGQVISRFGDYDWRAEGVGIWRALPLFTRSMDDALALAERVLPGWYVGVQANRYELLVAPEDWSAYLSAPKGHDFKGEVEASAVTPALALCLAILRATNPKGQPNV